MRLTGTGDRPLGLILIVLYKTIWGLAEVAAGLFMHSPRVLHSELTEDPQDLLVRWLLAHTHLRPEHLHAIGLVLILFGVGKIVLGVGIWYRSWIVRDIALWLMAAAGVVAAYELARHFTALRVAALIVDLLIVVYLWRMLPVHLPPRVARRQIPQPP